MINEPNPWKILSSRIAYQNPWMSIREDKVVTPTGAEGIYGVMESNDSVMVVVLNDKREVYLVRAFSYPAASWNWELPGGGGDGEDPIEASRRELEEETGILAKTWEALGSTRVCNGFMTERMTTYLARDVSFEGTRETDTNEKISQARFVPLGEVRGMVDRGEINDGQSIAGLYLLERWLAKHK